MQIPIERIRINEGRREINWEVVDELARSIEAVGLLNPITVVYKPDKDCYELIAGLHRIEAYKKLGFTTIEANVIATQSELQQQLAEIDENLIRAELHYIEKAELLKRRKEIYEAMFPNARTSPGRPPKNDETVSPFTEDTAKKSNLTQRQIQNYIRIAEALPEDVKETVKKIDLPMNETLKLIKHKPEEQKAIIKVMENKDLKRVAEAKRVLEKQNEVPKEYEIRKGDFKQVLSDIYEIDAIITDPPYPEEYLDCFSELAEFAKERLKDSGFLAVYSGKSHLVEVINRLSKHLTYIWTFALYHKGEKKLLHYPNVMCSWKPILIFAKQKIKFRFCRSDVLISEQREKDSHEWQQSESGVEPLIELLTEPGQLVVDPFAGSGTFLKVASKMGRRAIGAEIK